MEVEGGADSVTAAVSYLIYISQSTREILQSAPLKTTSTPASAKPHLAEACQPGSLALCAGCAPGPTPELVPAPEYACLSTIPDMCWHRRTAGGCRRAGRLGMAWGGSRPPSGHLLAVRTYRLSFSSLLKAISSTWFGRQSQKKNVTHIHMRGRDYSSIC